MPISCNTLPFPRSYYIRSFHEWRRLFHPDWEDECECAYFEETGLTLTCEHCDDIFHEYEEIRDQQMDARDRMFRFGVYANGWLTMEPLDDSNLTEIVEHENERLGYI